MAKKKKVESVDAKPPEFDSGQYIHRELLDSRISFVVLAFAIIMGVISGAMFGLSAGLSALIGLVGMLCLPFIIRLLGINLKKEFLSDEKKKLTEEERKSEFRGYIMKNIGQMGMYFLTWLAIFVLAVNVPILDLSAPTYMNVKAKLGTEGAVTLAGSELKITTNSTTGKKLSLFATITDNTKVDADSVNFTIDGVGHKPKRSGDNYEVDGLDPNTPMDVRIDAKDTLGHASWISFKIIISLK
jgi:hypothetical protein